MDVSASTVGGGKRKRNRKAKTFADYVVWEDEDTEEAVGQQSKRDRSASSIPSPPRPRAAPTTGSHDAVLHVKKVAGVQNATRKALEWLQYRDLSLVELGQSLPKLSKARVEVVMEALRAAGLVTLVRKHSPDAAGEDHVDEVYRFSAGRSAAEALEIGGGRPVALGSISKRIKASQAELAGLNQRINVLKAEAAKPDPEPQHVLEILQHFMKQDKTLEEDPFYSVAYKATCTAATKAAKAAAAVVRATVVTHARKQAAESAVESAALAAAAEARRQAQEAANNGEVEVTMLQAIRDKEEGEEEAKAFGAMVTGTIPASAASAAAGAHSTAALLASSVATSNMNVSAAPPSTPSPAAPAPSDPPAVATAVAEPPDPFVGELGGLVVPGTMASMASSSIPPAPPGGQQ